MKLTTLWRALRWLSGEDIQKPTPPRRHDDLEPYCDELTLLGRHDAVELPSGEARAIHKIGARYGAEL